MPAEDSFFQVVGLAPGAGASAPPDNVLLVPPAVFNPWSTTPPSSTSSTSGSPTPVFPSDPQAAAIAVQGRANHFQAAVAGGALVGDNLGTALTLAGEDARYANLLFLLLGLPGLALAAVVAGLVVALRSDRRRREVALLRLRGASIPQVFRMVTGESVAIAAVGALLGVPLAVLGPPARTPCGHRALPRVDRSPRSAVAWCSPWRPRRGPCCGSPRVGIAPVSRRRPREVQRTGTPWPLKAGLDIVLLAGAAVSFALTARSGYQVVLAPEGIPQTQVNYAALAGPALAWPGLALLVWRITAWVTAAAHGSWSRGGTGTAPELEAAALRRRHRIIARGAAGLAVALGLAVSTAIFTSTYDTQSRLDVALTVGSDVAVVDPPGRRRRSPGRGEHRAAPRRLRGRAAAAPVRLRRPGPAGPLRRPGEDVRASRPPPRRLRARLDHHQDPGNIAGHARRRPAVGRNPARLPAAPRRPDPDPPAIRRDHAYRPVDFHVIGQVTEWPTAPKDSFIVANADYITQQTGSDAVGTFLVTTPTPAATAASLRSQQSIT